MGASSGDAMLHLGRCILFIYVWVFFSEIKNLLNFSPDIWNLGTKFSHFASMGIKIMFQLVGCDQLNLLSGISCELRFFICFVRLSGIKQWDVRPVRKFHRHLVHLSNWYKNMIECVLKAMEILRVY